MRKKVNVFGTDMMLPSHLDVGPAVAGPCCLQLCAVLGALVSRKRDLPIPLALSSESISSKIYSF